MGERVLSVTRECMVRECCERVCEMIYCVRECERFMSGVGVNTLPACVPLHVVIACAHPVCECALIGFCSE